MSDRLHDHDTLGFRRGCVACAQLEADMAQCAQKGTGGGRGSSSQASIDAKFVVGGTVRRTS